MGHACACLETLYSRLYKVDVAIDKLGMWEAETVGGTALND